MQRGDADWRAALRCKIGTSDAKAGLAAAGTARRNALVERLVLDAEGIDNHRYEQPDPWEAAHEIQLRQAVAAYRTAFPSAGLATAPTLIVSPAFPWLVATPHALTDKAVVLFRIRQKLITWRTKKGGLTRAERAKAMLLAWVCARDFVELVDFWSGEAAVDDRLAITVLEADEGWLFEVVVPKLLAVWSAVQRRLDSRSRR